VLDKTYQSFFKSHAGYPAFKSKHDKQSIMFIKPTCISRNNLTDGKINLTKNLNSLKFKTSEKYNKYFLENKENIKSITISKNKSGVYHAAILFNSPERILNKNINEPINDIVGLDVGIKTFIVSSTGAKFENLKLYKNSEKKIKKLQKQLAKKKRIKTGEFVYSKKWKKDVEVTKLSNNGEKAKLKLAKVYEKINNQKLNYIHNITTQLVRENQTIVIEDLNVKGMIKNHNLAKSISDLSIHETFRQLKYKSEWYGRNLIQIDRWFPSSKKCSHCGYIYKGLTLNERTWVCPQCGQVHDRDANASLNIENEGRRILIGMWNSESKFVDYPTMDDRHVNDLKSSGKVKQKQRKNVGVNHQLLDLNQFV